AVVDGLVKILDQPPRGSPGRRRRPPSLHVGVGQLDIGTAPKRQIGKSLRVRFQIPLDDSDLARNALVKDLPFLFGIGGESLFVAAGAGGIRIGALVTV